jgi:hypothetical protein
MISPRIPDFGARASENRAADAPAALSRGEGPTAAMRR